MMKFSLLLLATLFSMNALAASDLSEAECKPNKLDGKIEGYKCEKIGKNGSFAKAGLKDGDLVKSVDGVAITDQTAAITCFDQVKRNSVKEMVIVRNGVEETLHPKFQ